VSYVIVFQRRESNIHLDIRSEIEASDSLCPGEALRYRNTCLAGFDRWGIDPTLKRAVGMFAFALAGIDKSSIELARVGWEKSRCTTAWQGDHFSFVRTQGAKGALGLSPEIDRNVVAAICGAGFIAAPNSIYRNVFKLAPVFSTTFTRQAPGTIPEVNTYWSLRAVAESGLAKPSRAVIATGGRARTASNGAWSLQRIADVPFGCISSGGLHSSTVVALCRRSPLCAANVHNPFCESDFQERQNTLRRVARHLGPTTLRCTSRARALEVMPKLPDLYDEPSETAPRYQLFRVATRARHVTVSYPVMVAMSYLGVNRRYQKDGGYLAHNAVHSFPPAPRCRVLLGQLPVTSTAHRSVEANRLALYLAARKGEECYYAQIMQRYDASRLVVGSTRRRRLSVCYPLVYPRQSLQRHDVTATRLRTYRTIF